MSSVLGRKSLRNRIIALALACLLVIGGVVAVFWDYRKNTNKYFEDDEFAKAIAAALSEKTGETINAIDVDAEMLSKYTSFIYTVTENRDGISNENSAGAYYPTVILGTPEYTEYYANLNYRTDLKDEDTDDTKEEDKKDDSSSVTEESKDEVVSVEASVEESAEVSADEVSVSEVSARTVSAENIAFSNALL